MRKLATVLLAVAVMPALADAPALTSAPQKFTDAFAAPGSKCYFIRQTNRQLQAPGEKPMFMPLASAAPIATPFANCMPEQRAMKAVIR